MDYEDELDLLSVVAVTQIDAEGKAHLDFHCNEYGTLLKSIPLVESWDVVSTVHKIQIVRVLFIGDIFGTDVTVFVSVQAHLDQ